MGFELEGWRKLRCQHVFRQAWLSDPFHQSASGRSVPDISADAGSGIVMCQASVSSSCFQEGGTSLATPMWASVWAIASKGPADAGLPIVSASGDYFYKMSTTRSTRRPQ